MKYLKKFKTVADANKQASKGLNSPHIDIIVGTNTVNFIDSPTSLFTCKFNEEGHAESVKPFVTGHTVGEIAYWDGEKIAYKPYTGWDASLGTAIAVCVIPSSHAEAWGDGKARFLSVKGMTSAGTESNEECTMYWRPSSAGAQDTPLTNCLKAPNWDNAGVASIGTGGCMSSDFITGTENTVDSGTYYKNTPYIPSPYAVNGSFYADYGRDIEGNSAFSEFDGKGNTSVLVGIDDKFIAANACNMYSTLGTNAGDWYLPAMGELGYVAARLKVIQDAIAKVGGVSLDVSSHFMGNNYWSSTEKSSTEAWRLYLVTMNAVGNNNKNYEYNVRPFIKLL